MTKAVGEIIREQMAKAGDYVETAADRAARANVNLQNKMEELGRKFAPLQEASNNLWTSMKIGIMDLIGGPLTNFINKLTEAGRIAQQYGVLGGNSKVGRLTTNLINAREGNRQSIYQQQQEQFWRYINPREQQIRDIRAWQSGQRGEALQGRINAITEKYGSLDATKIQAEVDAAKKMLADYQQAAKTILNPVKADIDTSGAENNVDSLKKKLKELEERRKKAIKAGDTELAENLTKQINQTKTYIRGIDPKALSTSTGKKTTPQEKASDIVTNAERTYAETLQKAAIRMEVGLDSTLEGKKKELAAQERLFDAYNDAYATYKDQKYKDAANEAADKIKSLAGEVKGMEDAAKQLKVKWEQGASGFNTQTMNAWMQGRQSDLSKAEYGSADYSKIMTNIADMNAIKTVLEQSMRAGIDAAQLDLEPLWEKVFDGDNIPDNVWQGMVDKINEKLKEIGIEPIKIDFKTGSIAKEGEKTEKSWQAAAQAVQSVGGAMQSIEDPAAKVAGTIAQAIASIALGYAQATTQAATLGPWAWVAFAATGMAQMISMISAIHSSTGYAEGGIIKGNSYSGDNLMAQGPNGQLIGLNAGEVVLNRAQQGVIAGALQGGGQTVRVVGKLSGESLFICAENWAKRSGKGEFVTWRQ
jgi:coenzyme F420-reducing hydrogenase delta subunit